MKITKLAIAATLLLASSVASATIIQGSYNVDGSAFTDPGLVVDVAPNPGLFDLDLSVGVSQTFGIFDIWTDENSVGSSDQVAQEIFVNFSLTNPVGAGTLGGDTKGYRSFTGFFQGGKVTWDNAVEINLAGGGLLSIDLSDEVFNAGSWWGTGNTGATVEATFTLLQDVAAVPEPSVIALFGMGLLGMGLVRRRKAK